MDKTNPYHGLNFNLRPGRISPRLIATGTAFVVFTVMWIMLPPAAFYWLFMAILISVVWVASFGWRAAAREVIDFLQVLIQR